jgi:hypothetical protein
MGRTLTEGWTYRADSDVEVEVDGVQLRWSGTYQSVEDRMVPTWVEIEAAGDDQGPGQFARVELRDGVPCCTELSLRSPTGRRGIRQTDLRQIEVSSLVDSLLPGLSLLMISDEAGRVDDVLVQRPDTADFFAARRVLQRARSGAAVRSITPELLTRVAQIYRENLDGKPTRAVREHFMVGERMASDYVQRARAAGLLPPTTPGKKRA